MSNNSVSSSTEANDDNEDSEIRRPTSPNFRTRQSTPSPSLSSESSPGSFPAPRFSIGSGTSLSTISSSSSFNGWLGYVLLPTKTGKKRKPWYRRRMALGVVLLVTLFFLVNSWMLYRIQDSVRIGGMHVNFLKVTSSELSIQVCLPFFLTISSSFGKLSLYLSFSSVEICSNLSK